ncbi:MAG: 16S rRNA (guanine(966)-N(2))-methyltransferase RsmD [Bacteroidales bacterium]|jgi:16S rRNA (guanine(966)-N(2))-methyltransferase RsmD|nr:16S rRNA (guanine(966)-N(2))-methyltransferase RsmD [Bacteroidales bacterium]MDD4214970.1 16S rRNA (guanine(966)-N(2))-methyltransferase RsmD [Bacteroidales bacterium]
MRIISGYLGGRKLHPPANLPVRPTTDLAKESLFNVLNNLIDFDNLKILDLFAGTGSISFEFVSRGCSEVTAIDMNHKCVSFIIRTCQELKIENLRAYRNDVFSFINHSNKKFDVIFADPPYDLNNIHSIPDLIFSKNLLFPDGLLIIEHPKNIDFSLHTSFSQHRNYGKVNFSFFSNKN